MTYRDAVFLKDLATELRVAVRDKVIHDPQTTGGYIKISRDVAVVLADTLTGISDRAMTGVYVEIGKRLQLGG